MNSYDAIIVGAGLAGLQCARLLARRGHRVLLVDRKVSLTTSIHTTGIFVRKTLEDFDIPDYCLGPPVKQVSLYSPALRELHLLSDRDEFRIGRMGMLYEHFLRQGVNAGVTWWPGTTYMSCTNFENGLIVKLARGGESHTVATRYLIGGDGARSRVARDLNLELNRETLVGVEKVFNGIHVDGPPRLLCFLHPQLAPGYIGWIAYDGEEAHVGVGGYAARFEPLTALESFQRKTSHLFNLENAEQVEQRGGLIPVGGVLRNIANERGLLIGDAAGAVSPLTAGGLDPCMRLSSLAATVVSEFIETGNVDALSMYSGNRFRARFTSRIWARRLAASLRSTSVVELACMSLQLPLFKTFARHVFFGRGSFPDVEMDLLQHSLSQ